ncbi:MAG: hypothetical protein IPF53_22740 [Blastocatellia bacterium]|nr:hypothetical protein [Blastocatellia bacterium]
MWVKPWIPANYLFTYVEGSPAPLVLRTRSAGGGGLEIAAEDELHPLRARTLESEFGFGAWTRTNGPSLHRWHDVRRPDNRAGLSLTG